MPGWRGLIHRLAGRGRYDLLLLAGLALFCAGLLAFAELASDMREGDYRTLDEAILLAMRAPADRADPIGPPWVEELGRDVTALGGTGVLAFLTLATAGYLTLRGNGRLALLLLAAVAGGQALSSALKLGFNRPRPDLVPHDAYVYTASFPSGHAMMAAVVYLSLAVMLARIQPSVHLRVYLVALAALLVGLIGISRVYLGVHWPTDVAAGWLAGTLWAALVWWLAHRVRARPQPR